ncbi:MAG: hypothetical protein ABFD79_03055 [Phycisphaerales bacterium]
MISDEKNSDNQKSALEDYVTVAIAEDVDFANEYRDILIRHNIPAVTATQKSYSMAIIGTAVMVPESLLDDAQRIIESQQDFDCFLDDAFNDINWEDERYDFNDGNGN